MLDDKFYLYARFKGIDASRHYKNNQNYLIEVKVGKFNKRVKIAHIHGYHNEAHEGSVLRYDNRADFESSWKVIKDVTHETATHAV